MSFLHVVVLAIVQGLAELLPVSSSAHVVVAEKLMGLDPSSPPMTLLLVMLHTARCSPLSSFFGAGGGAPTSKVGLLSRYLPDTSLWLRP